MTRAAWMRPELVVLGRGVGEEHVLTICKTADEWPDVGPQDGYSACYIHDYCYEPGCSVLGVS